MQFDGWLFDMDGTLLTSIPSVERVWSAWAERNGIEVASFLKRIHGVQAVEVIRRENLPGLDPQGEAEALADAELRDMEGTEAIPGAAAFLSSLPAGRWAIVTSAHRRLALARLAAVGIPLPEVLICAEDVPRSKPAPDGFLLAAEQLGVDPARCVVFEDSQAGVAAGEAAGAAVIVVGGAQREPWIGDQLVIQDYHDPRLEMGGALLAATM
jgi:sugar-phosphatase